MAVANSSSASTGAAAAPIPVPPAYTACIARLYQQAMSATPKPKKAPSTATLKSECASQYSQLTSQVMAFLISADWLEGEAHDQGISVTDKAVLSQFASLKAQQFPQSGSYAAFLTSSGMTQNDLLYRVRLNLLSTQIQNKVSKSSSVSQAAIASYYEKNKSNFGSPEKRDLRLILVPTAAKANSILAQLKKGGVFAQLARKNSTDSTTKSSGGADIGIVQGELASALNTAVFAAPLHKLEGPVKTPFGYYIFIVQKITKGTQQTLAQASAAIKAQLQQQGQETALQNFVNSFNKKWKAKTNCRSQYAVADCSNAPKTTASSLAASQTSAG
jgi:foldase protein PrsA